MANYCQTSKVASEFCKNNAFWKDKYKYDFGFGSLGSRGLNGPSMPVLTQGEKWVDVYKRKAAKVLDSPLSTGYFHYAMIDDQGKLYTLGGNHRGQLGNGTKDTLKIPFMVLLPKIISVACGSSSTIAITENGETYGWGEDIFSEEDYGGRSILKPTLIKYMVENLKNPLLRAEAWMTDTEIYFLHKKWPIVSYKPLKVSCNGIGWGVIFDNGLVYYSIRIGRKYKQIRGMVTLKDGILDISASNEIFAMISKNGQLYMFGTNFDDTYIGTPGGYSKVEPAEIILPLKPKIKQVSLSQTHITVLTENGNIYTWGKFLEDPPSVTTDMTPKKLSSLPKISFISSGAWVTAAITTEGKLYMWGKISYGGIVDVEAVLISSDVRISNRSTTKYAMLPAEINIGHKVNYIAVGDRFSIASTEDGMVNYWGDLDYSRS